MKTKLILVPRPADLEDVEDTDAIAEAVIESHPDGYYWVSVDGRRTFGPFATAEDARADSARGDGDAPEPCETLEEAELELGIADWIDPDSGVPAEGLSTPHLVDD